MVKIKKNYVVLALITAIAMLFAGISVLFGAIGTNTSNSVSADDVNSIAGTTWQIKNKPLDYLQRMKVDFTSNDKEYHMLNMGPWGEPNGYYYMMYISSAVNYNVAPRDNAGYTYDGVGSYNMYSDADESWVNEAYQTITFAQNAVATIWDWDNSEFVDGTEELLEWLHKNARRIVDGFTGLGNSIWTFADVLGDTDLPAMINFESNGEQFEGIEYGGSGDYVRYIPNLGNYDDEDEATYTRVYSSKNGWNEDYKTIIFAENAVAYVWDSDANSGDGGFVLYTDDALFDILSNVAEFNGYHQETPQTGVVLDIILPSLVILMTLAMTIVVWKKKEY